jgi:hypothetical protein
LTIRKSRWFVPTADNAKGKNLPTTKEFAAALREHVLISQTFNTTGSGVRLPAPLLKIARESIVEQAEALPGRIFD